MENIEKQQEVEQKLVPNVNKETYKRILSQHQILKILEDENISELEPWQNFNLYYNNTL